MTKHPYLKARTACLCLCLSVSFTASIHSQERTAVHSIITDTQTEIVCKSMSQATEKHSVSITVLNSKGVEEAMFVCGCDMFCSLQKFSGEIFNASQQSVRKIKKSDLQKSAYSTSLATDEYFYYYECNYPTFPFTVTYSWEIKCNNGLIGYPSFVPQATFNQSVEKASYRIELPEGQTCRHYGQNLQGKNIQVKVSKGTEGQQIIEATASKLPPVEKEPFGPPPSQLFPRIHFAPSAFRYDKTEGDISSWQKYGEWQYELLKGRDQLPEASRQTLRELTANCSTDRDKVKAVYDYLAQTTRYVSIQLGIGGLQPIAASEVYRTGFGDCKGLSNYMLAMLKELGIPATYTVISTQNERLIPNYSSANQMDHVILQVPLPQDTLWLECTNPSLPFGYIHQSIAGHDALLIEPTGGRIYRLPSYPDSLHMQHINARVTLSPTAETRIEVDEVSRLFQYEDEIGILLLEPNQRKDRIRSGINLPQADILNLQISERKDPHPSVSFRYGISSRQYGQQTGNRLFVPVNVFRRSFSIPRHTTRTSPIHIGYGYSDQDSITLLLPDGYAIEALPHPVTLQNKFGKFRSSITVKGKEMLILHQLTMYKGIYNPEEYEEFIHFRKQVAEQYNGKIILKKEQ